MTDLPTYYFRIREPGAAVFRVAADERTHRIDMTEIAGVNLGSGKINPRGSQELSEADRAEIERWLVQRRKDIAARDRENAARTREHLNQTAQWAQSRATDEELEAITDDLLMAMHDLRSVLVQRKARRAMAAREAQDGE